MRTISFLRVDFFYQLPRLKRHCSVLIWHNQDLNCITVTLSTTKYKASTAAFNSWIDYNLVRHFNFSSLRKATPIHWTGEALRQTHSSSSSPASEAFPTLLCFFAYLWFRRNLGSIPFLDVYLCFFGFFIPFLWALKDWLCAVWFLDLAISPIHQLLPEFLNAIDCPYTAKIRNTALPIRYAPKRTRSNPRQLLFHPVIVLVGPSGNVGQQNPQHPSTRT